MEAEPPLNEQRPEVCALIPLTARRVLDLGCHAGGLAWRLKQDRPGIHVTGVDVDPEAELLAKPRMDAFWRFDLASPNWQSEPWAQAGGYDTIIAADVIEHVADPWSLVRRMEPLLAPGGVIVASVPQIRNVGNLYDLIVRGKFRYFDHSTDPPESWCGPQDNVLSIGHLRLWTKSSIEELFDLAGLRITRWEQSRMSAPGLEPFAASLIDLCASQGGDVAGLRESLYCIQWLFVAERKDA